MDLSKIKLKHRQTYEFLPNSFKKIMSNFSNPENVKIDKKVENMIADIIINQINEYIMVNPSDQALVASFFTRYHMGEKVGLKKMFYFFSLISSIKDLKWTTDDLWQRVEKCLARELYSLKMLNYAMLNKGAVDVEFIYPITTNKQEFNYYSTLSLMHEDTLKNMKDFQKAELEYESDLALLSKVVTLFIFKSLDFSNFLKDHSDFFENAEMLTITTAFFGVKAWELSNAYHAYLHFKKHYIN